VDRGFGTSSLSLAEKVVNLRVQRGDVRIMVQDVGVGEEFAFEMSLDLSVDGGV
jgi:hypothetical protein